jgi:hypothetical protein
MSALVADVRPGTKLVPGDGFTCLKAGEIVVAKDDGRGLYVDCSNGKHYLDGQSDDGKIYIGFDIAADEPAK